MDRVSQLAALYGQNLVCFLDYTLNYNGKYLMDLGSKQQPVSTL